MDTYLANVKGSYYTMNWKASTQSFQKIGNFILSQQDSKLTIYSVANTNFFFLLKTQHKNTANLIHRVIDYKPIGKS